MNAPPETVVPPPPGADSVIHDIGYRHYDGPRLGRGYARRSLFVDSLRGAYGVGRSGRSKVTPMLLLVVMCLPAGAIVAGTAVTGADALLSGYTSYAWNMQIVIAIYVAGQAPASVSRDLRFRVTSLYFSRPIERIDYVAARFAAMASAILLLIAAPLTILLVGALVAGLPLAEQLPDYLRALAGGLVLALLLAGIALVVAATTPRRGLGVAAVIAVLVVAMGVQGVVQGIAVVEGAEALATYAGLLSPFALVDGIQVALLGAETLQPAPPSGPLEAAVFALVALALVGASIAALLLRYRKVAVS